MRFLRKDGTEVPVIQTVHAVRCPDGTVDYMLSQYQDITSRKRQEESLRESEEVGRAIFEQATVGIAHVSPDGQWQRANERLCRTLGFAADELVGRQFLEAIAEAGRPEAAERMQDMLAGEGESHMAEVMCLRRDGGSWWCVLGVRLVRTVHGEPRFFVVVLEDVDARKRAEQELELLNRELQRSNEELQQFAYVASHDLQEPLRMVSSYTQLLQESYGEQLGENGHKWIHYAVDGARRMQTLIQDLLSYSRVATRHHAFEVVDSHAALGRALGNLRPVIDESQALVSNGDLPDVPADPGQLTQVFQNLIGNSIKYRREGHPPHIHVSAIRQGAFWEFSVADNGIGIDARFRDRVFVIFQRLHTRQEYPGTGIGLAICRRIVERHGGEIWFESELGKGTTFRFTLAAAPEGTEST
jgi:PAS domain S-box-containing protein